MRGKAAVQSFPKRDARMPLASYRSFSKCLQHITPQIVSLMTLFFIEGNGKIISERDLLRGKAVVQSFENDIHIYKYAPGTFSVIFKMYKEGFLRKKKAEW
jgi:hypothetical protein